MLKIETVPPLRNSTNTESIHKHSDPTGTRFSLDLETERRKLGRAGEPTHEDSAADSVKKVRPETKPDAETSRLEMNRSRKAAKAAREQLEDGARQIVPPGEMNVDGIPCPIGQTQLPIAGETASDPACLLGAVLPSEAFSDVSQNVLPQGQSGLSSVTADMPDEVMRDNPRLSQPGGPVEGTNNPDNTLPSVDDARTLAATDFAEAGEHATVPEPERHQASVAAFQVETEGAKVEGKGPESTDSSRQSPRSNSQSGDLGPEPSALVSPSEMRNGDADPQYSQDNHSFPDPNGYGSSGNSQGDPDRDNSAHKAGANASSLENHSSLAGAFEANGSRGVEQTGSFRSLMSEHASSTGPSDMLDQIERADVMSQLVEKSRLFRWENNSELHISLRPETLGHVTLRASIVDRTLVATIAADSDRVRHLLELELPSLHRALREDGMLAKVVVAQGSDLNFNNPSGGQPQSQLHQQNPSFRASSGAQNPWLTEASATAEGDLAMLPDAADSRYLSRSIHLIA